MSYTARWQYPHLAQPAGVVLDPEALWVFDGSASSFDDRTANGHDLSTQDGTPTFERQEDLIGGVLDNVSYYAIEPNVGVLRTFAAVTIETLFAHAAGRDTYAPLFFCGGDDYHATWEPANWVYSIRRRGTGLAGYDYFHELGSGQDRIITVTGLPQIGAINHLVVSRASNGRLVSIYFNGKLVNAETLSGAPTGGDGDTRFCIGANERRTYRLQGIVFGMKVTLEEFSAAQVAEAYAMCRY